MTEDQHDPAAPYEGFGGTVRRVMAASEPWWPPRPVAPEGAPNVVVILVDDVGFADIGCYGGEILTPNLDLLAAEGVRFTNWHVNPMCSPTRASLLTGVNAHAAGVGHVAQDDPGFPGYAGELAEDVVTAAETFRAAGYATLMVGKWHLCRDADVSARGPKHSWPVQRGFDRFYGILDGFTNLHHPHHLVEDNSSVHVDAYPEGYFLTDDLTERAITMVKERKAADPSQPFFLYFAHAAAHAPLHAKAGDIARYTDTYRAGWDVIRAARHQRQLDLGVIPPGTPLPPRNTEPSHEVVAWDELTAEQQELYARYMAVYAAMVDSIDQSLGRLRLELERMGEWDNTIVVFMSDNGASREGEATGTTNYYNHLGSQVGVAEDHTDLDVARLDLVGGPRTMPHYPRGWAMAGNTPFRLYKRSTHAGGHQVPCIWHWPAGLAARGELRTQYAHVTDVLPTLLDLTGVPPLTERHGRPVKPMNGSSLAATLTDPAAPPHHREQYYELAGNRGFYRDGWEVVTDHSTRRRFTADEWELYDLRSDPNQLRNLAGERPDLVAELDAGWEQAAWANQVFPLDEGSQWRWIVRPPHDAVFEAPVTIWPGTPTLERWRCSRLIWSRNCTFTVSFAWEPGDRGILVAHGDQGGGYALYVDGGRLWFVHNDGWGRLTTLDAGAPRTGGQLVAVDLVNPGQRTWNVVVRVDGEEDARGRLEGLRAPFPIAPFEGIDVGIDRRSPVSWELYERDGPFPYSGVIDWVRYEPGELAPDNGERWIEFVREMGARYE